MSEPTTYATYNLHPSQPKRPYSTIHRIDSRDIEGNIFEVAYQAELWRWSPSLGRYRCAETKPRTSTHLQSKFYCWIWRRELGVRFLPYTTPQDIEELNTRTPATYAYYDRNLHTSNRKRR